MNLNDWGIKAGNMLFKYRGQIPLFFYAFAMIYMIGFPEPVAPGYTLRLIIYLFITLIGFILRIDIVGHVPAGTSGRNRNRQVANTLNTSGWYSILRHPLYVSNFMLYLGPLMLTESLGFICVYLFLIGIYYKLISLAEDDFLSKKFSGQYMGWALVTPAFIPVFQHFRSSTYPFSFKKVLINEYHMILEIPLSFIVLIITRDFSLTGRFNLPFWAIIFIGMSVSVWLLFHVIHLREKKHWE